MVAKFLFVGLIFAAVVFFLRFLFGPGGRFREDWIDEDNARLRAEEKERLEEMDRKGIPRPRKGLTERLLERLAGIGNRDKDGR